MQEPRGDLISTTKQRRFGKVQARLFLNSQESATDEVVRESCVIRLCIVVQSRAIDATDALRLLS